LAQGLYRGTVRDRTTHTHLVYIGFRASEFCHSVRMAHWSAWLVGVLLHSVPTAVSLQTGAGGNATGHLQTDRSWSCSSIAASSFTYQYDSYLSGSTIVLTNNQGSQRGRAYYTWANSGGFRINFDMWMGGGSGADGMCMKYGGYDSGEFGEYIAGSGSSLYASTPIQTGMIMAC